MYLALSVLTICVLVFCVALSRARYQEDVETQPTKATSADTEKPEEALSLIDFKKCLMKEILRRDKTLNLINVSSSRFDIGFSANEDDSIIVSLDGMYSRYLEQKSSISRIIFQNVDMAMEAVGVAKGSKLDISPSQLAVILRHKDYTQYLEYGGALWKPFFGDLIAMIVFYYPGFLTNATLEDTAGLGLTADEAWLQAARNLETKFNDITVVTENQGARVISAESGLATGHLWLLCKEPNKCNFDSMVINKESYMFAENHDSASTKTLAGIAAKFVRERNTLSDNLISAIDGHVYASRLEGNRWLPIERQ